jgi:hypothetical protein
LRSVVTIKCNRYAIPRSSSSALNGACERKESTAGQHGGVTQINTQVDIIVLKQKMILSTAPIHHCRQTTDRRYCYATRVTISIVFMSMVTLMI